MSEESMYPCPNCQIGHCHMTQATYVQVYGDLFISAPHMRAWVCDICGYQEFDRADLLLIETLVGQVNQPSAHGNAPRTTAPDAPESKTTPRRAKP
jgi:hypothetical protein